MNVSIVTERGDALIATAARASFNRRADLLEKANDIIAKWYGATLGATRK